MGKDRWARIGNEDDDQLTDIHVVPINDRLEHEEMRQCWCRPRIEEGMFNDVIVHNAADGREYWEENDTEDSSDELIH